MNSKGEPYGPERYKEIVKERYYIAKQGNISYSETGKMTPMERSLLLDFILEDLKMQQDIINKQISKTQGI